MCKVYTFDDITSHLQRANLAVSELLTKIWGTKSKATAATRKAGELSEERLADLAERNAATKGYRLAHAQQKLICYSCTGYEAHALRLCCGGKNRDQTICRPCYEKERQANINGPRYGCNATATSRWHHNGGEKGDQTICQSSYGKERQANIQGFCEDEDCGATESVKWHRCRAAPMVN